MAPSTISDLARDTLRLRISDDSISKQKPIVPPPQCKKETPAASLHCALYCQHHTYIHPKIAPLFAKAVARLLAGTWAPPSLNNGDRDTAFVSFATELMGRTQVQGAMVVICMMFLDKLWQKSKGVKLGRGSEYRLFTTALMLANKVMDDHRFPNVCWADLAGVTLEELNVMERELLDSLDFNLHIPHKLYLLHAEKFHRSIVALTSTTRPPAMSRIPSSHPRSFSSPVAVPPSVRRGSVVGIASPAAYSVVKEENTAPSQWMSPRTGIDVPSRHSVAGAAALQQVKRTRALA